MKVTTIILGVITCFSSILLANPSDAQHLKQIRLNIRFQQESLAGALAKLENATHIAFAYDKNVLKEIKSPGLVYQNQSLDVILQQLLKNSGFEYQVLNNNIVIGRERKKPVPPEPGKIYGKILDDKGEALPGASIKILELNKVMSSAVDGSYSFSAVPGIYTLEISYISYQRKQIRDVEVKPAGLTKLDVVLQVASNALKGVVIQSTFKKEAVAGLYVQQKNAAGITDGVSAEQIARTPDNNMGQVLKRISGVTTVDNKYVIVRGLTERYNQGMIDGIVLPSTDMSRRNFSFDVIPAEMVSNVVVNKTATPDVSAEFSGGQVSVNTLDIPLENFSILSLGTGFNSNTLGKNFVQAGKRGKYDFLGFDDGHRKAPANFRSWPFGGNNPPPDFAGPQGKVMNPDAFKLYNYTGGLNQNYRLSAGRVYNLKGDQKWGFVAGLSLRNTQESSKYQDVRNLPINHDFEATPKAYIDTAYGRRNGNIYKYNATMGAQFNAGIQGKDYKIGWKNIFSQVFNNSFNSSEGSRPGYGATVNESRTKKSLQDPQITRILQHKLDGEHNLTAGGLKLSWLGAITTVRQETKDRTKFIYALTGKIGEVEYFQNPNVVIPGSNDNDFDYRIFTDAKERNYNWAVNLSQPFGFLGDKSLIKAGYNGTFKRRKLYATRLDIYSEDRNFDAFSRPYEELMSPERIGTGLNQAYYLPYQANGLQFNGVAKLHAGYLMLDQRFLSKIRLVYGMRMEKYELKNDQERDFGPGLRSVTGEKNTQFLPSVNFTYSITPKMNFRASFSKTIIRPDFRETSYFGFYDVDLDANIEGADLLSTKIKNTDLRYEWYPSAGEIISVSGFYKSFDKPIELVAVQDATGTVTQFRLQNQKDALNYGLEIELRKSLGFIADKQWLRNLSLFGNGSVIKSKINTLSYLGDGTIVVKNEKRALFGQSPYIINAGISYISPDYGLTISYNRSGRRTYTISTEPIHTEYENGRNLVDLQLFCRLMKRKVELKLNVGNLLDTETLFYMNANGYKQNEANDGFIPKFGKDSYEKKYDDVRYRIKQGRNSSLSVSYKF